MPLLASKTLCLNDGQSRNPDFGQRGLYFFQLERSDDSFNFFHSLGFRNGATSEHFLPLRVRPG